MNVQRGTHAWCDCHTQGYATRSVDLSNLIYLARSLDSLALCLEFCIVTHISGKTVVDL